MGIIKKRLFDCQNSNISNKRIIQLLKTQLSTKVGSDLNEIEGILKIVKEEVSKVPFVNQEPKPPKVLSNEALQILSQKVKAARLNADVDA